MAEDDTLETNIAITLRDIAANCDQKSGKAIRACEAAARDGLDNIELKTSIEDRTYLFIRERSLIANWEQAEFKAKLAKLTIPPLIQKMESLGFKLESSGRLSSWYQVQCYIIARW